MNFYVQQSITIQFLKIGGITNSSVLQIGSAGIIKPVSNLYNTGGFTGPAPQIPKPGTLQDFPSVPLSSPTG
ncbi:spore germination protein GerPB [Bacillus benzoevorans]|uniref:Spore germination protein PB n=1 Tax=Bacillus benzoevorans TaxID=1456 RepID=A0A7X0LUE6_9BACI|nr:spore germination protein GerPB [Bacillus benzoevorans]MBB6443502.1 spore germination protein PB [Bacillus benzoevorans]